jgi:hypothetical protein
VGGHVLKLTGDGSAVLTGWVDLPASALFFEVVFVKGVCYAVFEKEDTKVTDLVVGIYYLYCDSVFCIDSIQPKKLDSAMIGNISYGLKRAAVRSFSDFGKASTRVGVFNEGRLYKMNASTISVEIVRSVSRAEHGKYVVTTDSSLIISSFEVVVDDVVLIDPIVNIVKEKKPSSTELVRSVNRDLVLMLRDVPADKGKIGVVCYHARGSVLACRDLAIFKMCGFSFQPKKKRVCFCGNFGSHSSVKDFYDFDLNALGGHSDYKKFCAMGMHVLPCDVLHLGFRFFFPFSFLNPAYIRDVLGDDNVIALHNPWDGVVVSAFIEASPKGVLLNSYNDAIRDFYFCSSNESNLRLVKYNMEDKRKKGRRLIILHFGNYLDLRFAKKYDPEFCFDCDVVDPLVVFGPPEEKNSVGQGLFLSVYDWGHVAPVREEGRIDLAYRNFKQCIKMDIEDSACKSPLNPSSVEEIKLMEDSLVKVVYSVLENKPYHFVHVSELNDTFHGRFTPNQIKRALAFLVKEKRIKQNNDHTGSSYCVVACTKSFG